MNKEQIIEEMAKTAIEALPIFNAKNYNVVYKMCEALYNAGYRKVVMCKDCKYCTVNFKSVVDEAEYICIRTARTIPVDPTDYCSRAKMRGE